MIFLDAVEKADAASRLAFVIDTASVVGGIFGGGKTLEEHIDSLRETISGE